LDPDSITHGERTDCTTAVFVIIFYLNAPLKNLRYFSIKYNCSFAPFGCLHTLSMDEMRESNSGTVRPKTY